MSSIHQGGNAQPTIDREEHRSVNGVDAKAVVPYLFDGTSLVPGGGGMVPQGYDYVEIPSYDTNNNPLTVTYKVGGSGGTTVATLTITYSGTNISSVTRT